MPQAENPVAGDSDLVPGEERPASRMAVSAWTSTAAAAVLHGAVLFAGSQAEAAPPEQTRSETIDDLRRYLAASEARDAPRDVVSTESQARVLNRLTEGANGAGADGDDTPREGSEKKASAGHLSSAAAGAGSGKTGSGTGKLAPFKVRYGRLPPEVIQRIVRQNFARFRLCFENSQHSWSALWGRVTVRFVISTTGAVTSAIVSESTLWERGVRDCVVRGVRGLVFPQPEGGVVVVNYPFMFSPGG